MMSCADVQGGDSGTLLQALIVGSHGQASSSLLLPLAVVFHVEAAQDQADGSQQDHPGLKVSARCQQDVSMMSAESSWPGSWPSVTVGAFSLDSSNTSQSHWLVPTLASSNTSTYHWLVQTDLRRADKLHHDGL